MTTREPNGVPVGSRAPAPGRFAAASMRARALTSALHGDLALPMLLLAVLVAANLVRPLMPIDETRYAAVAWEMWIHGDFLVPRLDGLPYAHKPPLLFWLMHAGWSVFGVNAWWPRLISPLFTAGTLALLALLARDLWPTRPATAAMAPLLLVGATLPAVFATALMFDAMLAFFVTLGWLGLVRAGRAATPTGFVLLAVALAGALLAKGPVALVHLLPPMVLAPWWLRQPARSWAGWAAGCTAALGVGTAVVLAWAVPAALAGGEAYRAAIFWRQSAGRVLDSFAHAAPWWLHLAGLPVVLAPWLPWAAWWQGLRRLSGRDDGLRLLVVLGLPAFLFFSAISGKRWQYLLPELGVAALLAARAVDGQTPTRWSRLGPVLCLGSAGALVLVAGLGAFGAGLGIGADTTPLRASGVAVVACALALILPRAGSPLAETRRLAGAAVVSLAALILGLSAALREPYDVQAVATELARFEAEARPVAINIASHGQWTFAGRLHRPLAEIRSEDTLPWLSRHPAGRVLFVHRGDAELPRGVDVVLRQRWRGRWIAILATPAALEAGTRRGTPP